jgi:hypothetical protein
MEDMEYLLDRIAFLEDRLAHLEALIVPSNQLGITNLIEAHSQIQAIKNSITIPEDKWYLKPAHTFTDKDYLYEDGI